MRRDGVDRPVLKKVNCRSDEQNEKCTERSDRLQVQRR